MGDIEFFAKQTGKIKSTLLALEKFSDMVFVRRYQGAFELVNDALACSLIITISALLSANGHISVAKILDRNPNKQVKERAKKILNRLQDAWKNNGYRNKRNRWFTHFVENENTYLHITDSGINEINSKVLTQLNWILDLLQSSISEKWVARWQDVDESIGNLAGDLSSHS